MNVYMIAVILVAVIWYWLNSLQARESATQIAKDTCLAAHFIFLDGTVALKKFQIQKDNMGNWRFRRTYNFEYTEDGDQRCSGFVIVFGKQVETIGLESG